MSEFSRTPVVALLSAVSANGAGAAINLGGPKDTLTLEVYTTGTVSAFSVQVQGSLDGINWENVGAAITAATAGTAIGTGVLLQYFQATLSGYTGTGTVTAVLAYGSLSAGAGGSVDGGGA